MNDSETLDAVHDRRVASVVDAVTKLALLPIMTPEAVFEGAVKAAAVVMLADPEMTASHVAAMLRDMAVAIEHPSRPNLHLVKS